MNLFRLLIYSLLFTLFGSASSLPAQESSADAYYHFALARMLELREDYEGAIEQFEKALESDPESASLRTSLARTLLQSGDVGRAVSVLRQATALEPDYAEAHYVLGRIFYSSRDQEGMREQALEAFEKVLELEPRHTNALQDAAQLYFEQRDFERATELFARLRKAKSGDIGAYYFEAQARVELGQFEEALSVLEEGLRIRDDVPEYLLLMGETYSRLGQDRKAIETYRRGLAYGPDPRLNKVLAQTLVDVGEGEEAIPLLEKLEGITSIHDGLRLDLAKAYRQAKRFDQARKALEDILDEAPQNIPAGYELANLLAVMGEIDAAAERFEMLLESVQPTAERFHNLFKVNLALLRGQQGRTDEAVRLLEEVVEEEPEDLDARLRLLYAYREAGRREDALELSRQLMGDHGEETYVIVARGQSLAHFGQVEEAVDLVLGKVEEASEPELLLIAASQFLSEADRYSDAEELIEEALEENPESEKLQFKLGELYERQEEYASAEDVFKKILSRNPDHADVLNYLGYMLAERGERLSEALGYVSRAVELDPYNGAYLDSLGWVYFKKDELDKAELHLTRAAKLERRDPVILEHLGDLYVEKGDSESAQRFYRQALEFFEEPAGLERVQEKLNRLGVLSDSR